MRKITVTRQYHFESAHFLPFVREGHKCKRMHGHNYRIEVTVTGDLDSVGFIIDFWDMDLVIEPFVQQLDHRTLNDIPGLDNPTAENITTWFFNRLETALASQGLKLEAVTCFETDHCWATQTEMEPPQ